MLSLAVTYLAAAALLALMFALPAFLRWYLAQYSLELPAMKVVLAVFYACCPAGWAAVISLLRLLHNIRARQVFTKRNVALLRLLSWCFVFTALVCLAAAYWYPTMAALFVAAGFLAVILRVVKNVMAEATRLREESDLTI